MKEGKQPSSSLFWAPFGLAVNNLSMTVGAVKAGAVNGEPTILIMGLATFRKHGQERQRYFRRLQHAGLVQRKGNAVTTWLQPCSGFQES
jgi:hypothetical protein